MPSGGGGGRAGAAGAGRGGLVTAGSLPEVACTVWSTGDGGPARVGEVLLVHGGASGIGTHAIQVGKAVGAMVAVTAGSDARLAGAPTSARTC